MESSNRRVVITGIGVIAPNGFNLDTFWAHLRTGQSAASFVSRIDTSGLPSKVACQLRGFNPADYLAPALANSTPPATQYGIAAARLATRDAAIDLSRVSPDRIGIVAGSTPGRGQQDQSVEEFSGREGRNNGTLRALLNAQAGGSAAAIAHELGISAHTQTLLTGASTGTETIAQAFSLIRDDDADVAVAGAGGAPITAGLWGILCASHHLSRETEEPARAMKPFAGNRDGFILGEGAAFLVIEELSFALNRGAPIYAEILAHGRSFDGANGTPEDLPQFGSLEKALHRAKVHPGKVDYLNANGTATAKNDLAETLAIKKAFGSHAERLQISSTKPVTGHWAGAAGPVETVICALAIKNRAIPPTINLHTPDLECNLDFVPLRERRYPVEVAVNLNAGLDGSNACLILRRVNTK